MRPAGRLTIGSRRVQVKQFERELLDLLPRLRRLARSLTRDSAEADDLCQAAIEKALKRRSQWREESRLDAWMFMILRNCWIDRLRGKRRQSAHFVPANCDDHAAASVAQTADPLGAMHLHRAMNALPQEQQEAAALVWVEGFSYAEAASFLEIPLGTLTSRLSRARKRLLESLEVT